VISIKNKQITIGALISYAAIVFNIISGLLYTPWMIRTIGDDQYALYTLALSVVNLFMVDFGIGASVSKFLSNYFARGQEEEANRFLGIVYRIFILISAAIAVCLGVYYCLIDRIYLELTADELRVLKHLFIIAATHSVCTFPLTTFNGILMANERFIAVKACNLGQKVLSVIMIVAALLLGGNVYVLVLVHAVSNVVFLVVKYILIRRTTKNKADMTCKDRGIAKQLFSFSIWLTVMNLAQRCIFNIMPSVIAALIGSTEVTLFSIAATLEGYVYGLADAVNGMFMPRISRIIVKDQGVSELEGLMTRVGRFHVYTIGLLFTGFLCAGREFVNLWMGAGYQPVFLCAVLLIVPSMIDVPQQVAKTALLTLDVVKQQALIYCGMAVINLGLSFLLLPIMGAAGAALSICLAYLFRTTALNVLYQKHLKIHVGQYFRHTYLRWVPVAVLTVGIGNGLVCVIPMSGWLGLVVKCVCIAAVYAVLLFMIGIGKQERHVLYFRWKKKEK